MKLQLERNPGARFLFVAAALVVVIYGIRAASVILVPFLCAVFLAILNLPLLNGLRRWRVPLPLAVTAVVLINGLIFAFVVLVVTQSVEDFVAQVPRYVELLQIMALRGLSALEERGIDVSNIDIAELINASSITNLAGGALGGLATLAANTFLILIILIFILLEVAGFPEKMRRAMGHRADLGRWSLLTREIQRYLGIKTVISLATGILLGLWTWFLGVDFPLLWGMTAFLLNYVPQIGSIVAAIPPVVVALVQFGAPKAGAVVFGYIAVNFALGNVTEPQLMGRKLGLSSLMVVLSLLFWGWLLGPVGMLLAVPLTVILKITLEHTRDFRWLAVLLGSPSRDAVVAARLEAAETAAVAVEPASTAGAAAERSA